VTTGGEFLEFYHPEDGKPDGGHRQLWSASGYFSMVVHGLFGMKFDVDGVRFDPMVPDTFKNAMTLNNFIYRKDTLNMTITGPGKYIQSFTLDGVAQAAFVPGTLQGKHAIVMTMGSTPVSVLPGAKQGSLLVAEKIKLSANGTQGINLNFNSHKNVTVSLFNVRGNLSRSLSTTDGIVRLVRKDFSPGAYIVKWRCGNENGNQTIVLK
jgi:hypothetical protein